MDNQPITKKRFTIGYLDENAFDEYHSFIISGLFEAAEKYDMNVIRFGHFAANITYKHEAEINVVLDHIQQYNLDGLIFLGWARVATFENHAGFRKRFDSIPLISLGSGFADIPSVIFRGDRYIGEILLHLIHHGFRRIAFISPFWRDNRRDIYEEVMKAHGIYDSALCVHESEIVNLDVPTRGKKAVSILLDKHKVQFDAIVSLYNAETEGVIRELQARGFNVPQDVAVTSYEDGEIGKFASPALTTVYFPWRELGYYAGEKMAKLLSTGQVAMETEVPGRMVIRDSCGCFSSPVTSARVGEISDAGKSLQDISDFELKAMETELANEIQCPELDISALQKAFLNDYANQSENEFLTTLEMQIRSVIHGKISNIDHTVSAFRRQLLPFLLSSREQLLWSEDLFQQAQILLQDRLASTWAYDEYLAKKLNRTLQEISQILITKFNLESIMDSLEANLPRMNIPSCFIFIFNQKGDKEHLFDDCLLALNYSGHVRKKTNLLEPCTAKQKLKEVLFPEDRNYRMMGHVLHVSDEYIGFVVFEPGPTDERIYQALSIHISTALSGAMLLEKLDQSYKKLVEQAHKKGMADIATGILHNVNNVMNSVNASTHLIKDLVSSSPIEDFLKANQLLEKNILQLDHFIAEDPKGKKLVQFYVKLSEPFTDLHSQLLYNIHRLNDKINLVDDIVTSHQNYTGVKSTLEELYIVSVVEDALKINIASLEKYKIKVQRNYGDISNAFVQRTKLFHVLVNLIKNAKEAMMEVPEDSRELIISIGQDTHGKYIQISDTGVGISPENLETIFAYGYTTKKGGHGFGLHSCANYMTEMEGKIWAESEGPGKGATFVLQFK